MNWCFKCGISSDKTLLFDAISDKGIVKVCRQCALEEDLPIIKKNEFKATEPKKPILPRNLKVSMSNQSQRMYERLSKLSGVEFKEEKSEEEKKKLSQQEEYLKEIANKNYEERLKKYPGDESKLIDNFHWVIMRARRIKHMSPEQLAKEIGEPESAVKMLEQGIPPNNDLLVKKIEDCLKIRISKETPKPEEITEIEQGKQEEIGDFEESELRFDPLTAQNLTISDLIDMKKRKEKKERRGLFGFGRKAKKEEEAEDKTDEYFDAEIEDINFE